MALHTVLITGAKGAFGTRLLPLFVSSGFTVTGVTRNANNYPGSDNRAKLIEANLLRHGVARDLVARIRPDLIVHCAWETRHGQFWSSDENYRWASVSRELIDAAIRYGTKRFVFLGTCAEYTWGSNRPVSESAPEHPESLYGRAKLSVTQYLREQQDLGALDSVVVRLFFPYGPDEAQSRFVPYIIHQLLGGQTADLSAGNQIRDLGYTPDLARGLFTLGLSNLSGTVNLATGVGTSLKTVAECIGNQLQRPELLNFGAIDPRLNDADVLVADVTRVGEIWRPSIRLEEGIARYIDILKSRFGYQMS